MSSCDNLAFWILGNLECMLAHMEEITSLVSGIS
jgi:hypothetical protein